MLNTLDEIHKAYGEFLDKKLLEKMTWEAQVGEKMNDDKLNQKIEEYLTDKFCSKDSEVFKDECVKGIRSRCSEFETIKKLLFDFIKLEYKRLGIEFSRLKKYLSKI